MSAGQQPKDPANTSPAGPRGRARLAAVQALYQIDMVAADVNTVIDEFLRHRLPADSDDPMIAGADGAFFEQLTRGAMTAGTAMDAAITSCLSPGWPFQRLERIVVAILRVGGFEIRGIDDIPTAVSINEYVDIAHAFFAGKEPAFVNGVLDRLAEMPAIELYPQTLQSAEHAETLSASETEIGADGAG